MKTKTVTREYDAEGKLTRETTVEYESTTVVQAACTCHWGGTVPSFGYCPVHGYRGGWTVSSGDSISVSSGTVTRNTAQATLRLAS